MTETLEYHGPNVEHRKKQEKMKFLVICLTMSAAALVQGQYSTGNYQYSRDRISYGHGFNKPYYAQRQASGTKDVVPRLIHRNQPVAIPVTKSQFNVMFNAHGYQGNNNRNGYHGNTNGYYSNGNGYDNIQISKPRNQMSRNYDYLGNSAMLPLLFGMEHGTEQRAAIGMMMNSRQGNNMLPFYMMNQEYENMLPVMAFMNHGNQGGQRMNPLMMMTLHEAIN